MPSLLDSVTLIIESCKETSATLAGLIPPNQFWRWKEMWTNSLRTAVFSAALVHYLRHEKLLGLPEANDVLGSELNSWSPSCDYAERSLNSKAGMARQVHTAY